MDLALHILDSPGIATQVGSGVYIGTNWVLTVAQNLPSTVSNIRCGFGNRDRFLLTWVNAVNYMRHPEYNATNLDNNIGLIALASNPTNSPNILPISMATATTGQSAGYTGTIFGFGLNTNGQFTQILQQAFITITSDAECIQTYPHLTGRLDRNFCGVSEIVPNTPNICGGDQGGSFTQGSILVGLSSFIWDSNCNNGRPAGFTRVSAYREWILLNTGL